MTKNHLGSCLCQQVQYRIEGEFNSFFLCHCKHCQKDTGSAHSANLFSVSAKLFWLKGEEKVKRFQLAQTRHAKSFCEVCSSALPDLQEGNLLVVPAGSLDDAISIPPTAHIFCSSRAAWEDQLPLAKRFEKLPG